MDIRLTKEKDNIMNMIELKINGNHILFSYKTPVAGWDDCGAFRTEGFYSVTTSKHINKYFGAKDIGRKVPQSYIEKLVGNEKRQK
jgi:hypothetical protein